MQEKQKSCKPQKDQNRRFNTKVPPALESHVEEDPQRWDQLQTQL